MQTTTRTPAQAEQQLTHAADRFDHWRQTRTTLAEPIPQYLWEQAIALTTTFPITRVATRLRVSGGELKKRCAAHHAARAVPASTTTLGFVAVPVAPAWPRPTSGIEIELQQAGWDTTPDPRSGVPAPPNGLGADLFGDPLMLQLTPQSRILLATEPVDFRTGIDGLAAVCRQVWADNPLSGAIFVFRNRAGTALKLLCYDGQGFWLCTKRLSQGHFTWWPQRQDVSYRLCARELLVLLWNGHPHQARMAEDWRKLA